MNFAVNKLQEAYTATRAENHANFVYVEKKMKALKNFIKTTHLTQIIVSGYGYISTITLDGQSIKPTNSRTLTDIVDPSTSLPHDGQVINNIVRDMMRAL